MGVVKAAHGSMFFACFYYVGGSVETTIVEYQKGLFKRKFNALVLFHTSQRDRAKENCQFLEYRGYQNKKNSLCLHLVSVYKLQDAINNLNS